MKHYVATIVILLLTAGGHISLNHAQDKAARLSPPQNMLDIPSTIGPYRQSTPDHETDKHILQVLQTSTLLTRDYVAPNGWPIQLTIVYAGTTRRSLHFPEVCLVGAGWEVREQGTMPIGFAFTAKRLVLGKGDRKEAILYWFKTGDNLTGNFFLNSWHWAKNQVFSGAATSAMIKLAAPLGSQDNEKVFLLMEDFAAKLAPILIERVK